MATRSLLTIITLAALVGCASAPNRQAVLADGATAQVAILETTDIHSNVLSYDYYKQKADATLGYERVATLIRQARQEFPNHFLFDSGDTIQGTVLADFEARVQPVGCDEKISIYKAFDALGYDGGTAGNHEFNYGLNYLSQASGTPMNINGVAAKTCKGPNYPLVLSNVFSTRDDAPIFQPWAVVSKNIRVTTADGKPQTAPLRVGIIGFTPPSIMVWDKQQLEGKVYVTDVMTAAQRYLPELKAQNPDLIVGILHGGLSAAPYTPDMENGGWHLAGLPDLDVLLLGHSHAEFPGPRYSDLPQTDAVRGFVRGKPAVMASFFGKDLGVIDLHLILKNGRWAIDPAATHSQVRPICETPTNCVPADPTIAPLVAQAHANALAYLNTPIGQSQVHLSSYFVDVGNSTALAVVNAAQRDYVLRELPKQHPELQHIPVLSAAAAFRTGFGGPDDYTDVPAGALTLRSANDLYFYPNTLTAVKIDGRGLKAWLEHSAQRFHTVNPKNTGAQALINTRYTGYNFDQIQGGLRYVIDVTKPKGQRISSLTYNGKPVLPTQPFVVATNNYRASGGGNFPGLDGSNIVLASSVGNREIVAAWLKAKGTITAQDIEPTPWRFAPINAAGPLTFDCLPEKLGVAQSLKLPSIYKLPIAGSNGAEVCAIDLAKP